VQIAGYKLSRQTLSLLLLLLVLGAGGVAAYVLIPSGSHSNVTVSSTRQTPQSATPNVALPPVGPSGGILRTDSLGRLGSSGFSGTIKLQRCPKVGHCVSISKPGVQVLVLVKSLVRQLPGRQPGASPAHPGQTFHLSSGPGGRFVLAVPAGVYLVSTPNRKTSTSEVVVVVEPSRFKALSLTASLSTEYTRRSHP
jgi:hypothetical protein